MQKSVDFVTTDSLQSRVLSILSLLVTTLFSWSMYENLSQNMHIDAFLILSPSATTMRTHNGGKFLITETLLLGEQFVATNL